MSNAKDATIEQTSSGLVIREKGNKGRQLKLTGSTIMLGTFDEETGETKWRNGLSTDGLAAENITSGKINTNKLQIMNGNEPAFRWDQYGISAYNTILQEDGTQATPTNYRKFVRYDKHGLYGIDESKIGTVNWHVSEQDPLKEIDAKATFALTWEGLKVSYSEKNKEDVLEEGVLRVGRHSVKVGDKDEVYLISATSKNGDTEGITFSVDGKGKAYIAGGLDIGDGLDTTKKTDEYGNNTKFAWRFDVNEGMFMYAGNENKTRTEIFKIYDAGTTDTPNYQLKANVHEGVIGGWKVTGVAIHNGDAKSDGEEIGNVGIYSGTNWAAPSLLEDSESPESPVRFYAGVKHDNGETTANFAVLEDGSVYMTAARIGEESIIGSGDDAVTLSQVFDLGNKVEELKELVDTEVNKDVVTFTDEIEKMSWDSPL